jgi:hypothetical protein
VGVASVVPPVLLSEIATAETRGTITTLHQAPILYIHLFSFNRSILGGVDVGDFHCICVGLRHGDLCQPWLAIRAGKQRTNIYMGHTKEEVVDKYVISAPKNEFIPSVLPISSNI